MKTELNEKVSIITPVYNCEKYISQTIESVQNQTYSNWELILVDDLSTDNSADIIEKYIQKDDRIKYFKLKENSGAAVARNFALQKSTGRYVAYLDADDLWEKEKLQEQINFMKEHKVGFTCTSYKKIDEENNYKKTVIIPSKINYAFFLRNTIIQTVGVMVDTDIIDKKLLVMPNIRRRQDAATWCQILKAGYECYGIDKPLAYYRIVSNSLSSNKFKAVKGTWFLYRKIEKLSLLKSCFCFIGYAWNACKKRIYIKKNRNIINFYGPIDDLQGPGIKNKNMLKYLEKEYKMKKYNTYDTTIFNRIKFITSLIFTNKKVIIAVSSRGRKIVCPIIYMKTKLNKKFQYCFVIINGYILNEIEQKGKRNKKIMLEVLEHSQVNFVEIQKVKEDLEGKYNLNNIKLFENFKPDENYINIENFEKFKNKELKLVFLARVCKEKGIDTIIQVVRELREEGIKLLLDIYGPIFENAKQDIKNIENVDYINYRGIAQNKEVTKILSAYDIYVFPTIHKREGFPATIIDAYSAGLPVVASDICYNKYIVIDKQNGYIYNQNENGKENLKEIIKYIMNRPEELKEISKNNYKKSLEYKSSVVLNKFMSDFNAINWKI